MDAIERVREFCATWPALDKDRVVAYFTDDAVYRNLPFPGETIGGPAIANVLLGAFMSRMASVEVTVHHVASDGLVAFAERTERFVPKEGEPFELPVVGVFEMRGDRFCAWRDYFDQSHWRLPT